MSLSLEKNPIHLEEKKVGNYDNQFNKKIIFTSLRGLKQYI